MSAKTFATKQTIEQLAPLVRVAQRHRAPPKRLQDAITDQEIEQPAAIGRMTVYGVRDAKNALSSLLNRACAGDVTLIEAGKGGTVVLVSAEVLAGAFATLEEAREPTFGEAIEALPYHASELEPIARKGRYPRRGILAFSE